MIDSPRLNKAKLQQPVRTEMIKKTWLLGAVVLIVTAVALLYTTPLLTLDQRSYFSGHLSDGLFLCLVFATVVYRLQQEQTQISSLFWLLMGAATLSWLLLTLVFNVAWSSLPFSVKSLINGVCYFLFYALMIAAIEIKSYRHAGQLLSHNSLLIWTSTLSFTLGVFIYLVLTPSSLQSAGQQYWPSNFLFYMLMDAYLMVRWWYLAYKSRLAHWQGYGLLGLAMLNWLIADLLELLHSTNHITLNFGTFIDWLWFTPYLFLIAGFMQPLSSTESASMNRQYSRMNLFNSPLFFIAVILLLHTLVQHQDLFQSLHNNTQQSVFYGWLVLTFILGATQLISLIHQSGRYTFQLKENQFTIDSLRSQLQHQAQHLQQQSDSYKSILETTSNAIFTVDNQGNILSANPAATKMLGYSNDDFLTMTFEQLIEDGEELALLFKYQSYRQKLKRHSAGLELESIMKSQSGQTLTVHATVSEGNSADQAPLVISLADIREQKQAEEDIHRLKDQFTANISHEFRTPLTIINGVLDNLLNASPTAQQKQQISTAKTNGLRMVRMVEQLLELSRSSQDSITVSPINASHIIQFVCLSFLSVAKEKNIQFQFPEQQPLWITGNNQALEKIIFNLLSNAFKYTPAGGQVSLQITSQTTHFQFSVIDSGPGIDDDEKIKVFHRFYRADNTKGQPIHGVGIGLALVKELCDAMGWKVAIHSAVNQGAEFQIIAPIAEPQPEENEQLTELSRDKFSHSLEAELVDAQTEHQLQSAVKSQYLVLIIEDNADMQQHLNQILSPHHQCLLASNGEEGIGMALDYIPDIIISDVMMPGIDGFTALKSIRSNELTAHIPVIMLTAKSDPDSKLEGLQAEADDYLTKPFDARELLLRVANQIKSRVKLQQKLTRQWHFSLNNPEPNDKTQVTDKFVQKLNALFSEHYANADIPMSYIASELAMSERQLQRKVKAVLGVSPLEALRQFRLEKAKRLLQSNEQVGLAAQACGFSSQSYFGRCFKEYVGVSPSQYQKDSRESS